MNSRLRRSVCSVNGKFAPGRSVVSEISLAHEQRAHSRRPIAIVFEKLDDQPMSER